MCGDGANVLSAQTEEHITRKNETLFRETGAQIAVVAVDFLDGKDIEDYTYDLFNTWGVGSTQRDNGFLLVMAIAEENYYLQAGAGVDDAFDGATLQVLLDQYLEPDFAAEDYDAGALKLFDALYQEVEQYYQGYTDEYTGGFTSGYDYDYDYDYDDSPSFLERAGQLLRAHHGLCDRRGGGAVHCHHPHGPSSGGAGAAAAVPPAAAAVAAGSGPGCSWAACWAAPATGTWVAGGRPLPRLLPLPGRPGAGSAALGALAVLEAGPAAGSAGAGAPAASAGAGAPAAAFRAAAGPTAAAPAGAAERAAHEALCAL